MSNVSNLPARLASVSSRAFPRHPRGRATDRVFEVHAETHNGGGGPPMRSLVRCASAMHCRCTASDCRLARCNRSIATTSRDLKCCAIVTSRRASRSISPGRHMRASTSMISCRCLNPTDPGASRPAHRRGADDARSNHVARKSIQLHWHCRKHDPEVDFLTEVAKRPMDAGCCSTSPMSLCRRRTRVQIPCYIWRRFHWIGSGKSTSAGMTRNLTMPVGCYRFDTHASSVADAVWTLYAPLIARTGPIFRL